MKQKADWFAWVFQYIFGFIGGGCFAFAMTHKRFRVRSNGLITEHVDTFIVGMALIWAAMASFYGDRLWLGSNYKIIPPDDISHNKISRLLSIITGTLGVTLVFKSLLHNWGFLG
jgi:hypothetical protein